MPVPQRVQYPDTIEPLVQFIEDTSPEEILDQTLQKLRAGVAPQTMLTASALAVTRSTDMPAGHHGGPLHPLAGLYAVSKLVDRLEGEDSFLPVLQHVALTNKHIYHPAMGPFGLLQFAPEDVGGVEASKKAFLAAVGRGEYHKADHVYLWLWDHAPWIEAFDLLLTVAIPKNFHDDHYFMFPGTVWRAFEEGVLDKTYLPVVMRQVVRFVTRSPVAPNNPMPSAMPQIEALIEEHGFLQRILRQRSGEDETAAIGALGEAIGAVDKFADIPVMMAKALAGGLSLEGGGEALSIGAAALFLRSLGGNPMDVHLHTSVNLRRYLVRQDGISLKNKLLLLLTWHLGPEIRSTQTRMEPYPQPDMAAVAALPARSQAELLDAIKQSVYNQPPIDWSVVTNLGVMRAAPEVKETVRLATQYVKAGYDLQAFIACLGEIVCHDNFTEMHSFKHHQSIVEEFRTTREPWAWMHLVCGAQAAAISFGKNMAVYEEALDLLHAA
ncbi:MAG: hypothetical protein JO081_14185 [Alphaproteobacteria bacterium]|nr:hypothetical protein [Alphaproteobacteria bacterium]